MLPVLYYGEFSYTADVLQVDQKFKLEVKMVLNEHHKIDKIDLGNVVTSQQFEPTFTHTRTRDTITGQMKHIL